MTEQKKYPQVAVGVYIFNDQGELFMASHSKWNNKYVIPGGRVEMGESFEEAVVREVKEETNMDIENIEFVDFKNLSNLTDKYSGEVNHLVSMRFKAKAKNTDNIVLQDGLIEHQWLKPEDWAKRDDVPEDLVESIRNLTTDSENFEDKYKRALADYQNLLKRTSLEKMEFAKYANEQLLYEVIPVYDNLKTSIVHGNNENGNGWLDGVKYVVKQFKEALENAGVEEIKTENEQFDHNTMEAMSNEETEDEKLDGKVAKEVKAGYKLNGKVIIPARVIVYKLKN